MKYIPIVFGFNQLTLTFAKTITEKELLEHPIVT